MRVGDLNKHLQHDVRTHKRGCCSGCPVCQRINAGRGGKGAALRLAVEALEDSDDQLGIEPAAQTASEGE